MTPPANFTFGRAIVSSLLIQQNYPATICFFVQGMARKGRAPTSAGGGGAIANLAPHKNPGVEGRPRLVVLQNNKKLHRSLT
jgi:hypothetical protein